MIARKHLAGSVLLVAAAGWSAGASAQGYVGAGAGVTRAKIDCVADCDNTSTGFKVFGGYDFHPYFGVEAAYVTLGKATITGLTTIGVATVEAKTQGAAVFAVAKAEDTTWRVFGKLGFASLKTDLELRSGTAAFTDDDTATDVAWGLGIGWKVAPRWLVQLEYERFRPEVLGEKAWVQFTSLGVAYRF